MIHNIGPMKCKFTFFGPMKSTVNSSFFVVGLRKCKLIVTLFCRQQLQRIQSPGHDCRGPQALQTLLWQVWITKTPYPHPTPLGPGSCLPTGGGEGGMHFHTLATPLVHSTVLYTCFPPGYAPGTLYSTEHPNPCPPPPPTPLLPFSKFVGAFLRIIYAN